MELTKDEWILVTGGTGFVGQALVRRLLAQGYRIRVVSRSAGGAARRAFLDGLNDQSQLDWFVGDIAGASGLDAAFDHVRYVFHVAALVNSAAPRASFDKANVTATERICDLALRHGVAKLVHVSTCDVFGLPEAGEIISETTPYRPWNEPYADSKIQAARVVRAYQGKGLVCSIIYPGWVYGPGDRAFFPALVRQLRRGVMASWCRTAFEIHLVYIEDLVDALLLALHDHSADNDDFLILDEASGLRLEDLCRRIAVFLDLRYRMVPVPYWLMYLLGWTAQAAFRLGLVKEPALSTTNVKAFGFPFRYSTAKARSKLSWRPRTMPEEGIRKALEMM
jgi:nucleoside-diphosphate-sugar epimerase